VTRRDPRRVDAATRRVRALLQQLEAELPAAERLCTTLEELARQARLARPSIPARGRKAVQNALVRSHRSAHAAQDVLGMR
jgi:hypothetical protein